MGPKPNSHRTSIPFVKSPQKEVILTNEDDDDYLSEKETTYIDTNSLRGAASLSRAEIATFIDHPVSQKLANMLNAMSRDEKIETLKLKIKDIVEKLRFESKIKEDIMVKAEQMIIHLKKIDELDANEIAIATITPILQSYGWSLKKITQVIETIDKRFAAVKDLEIAVNPEHEIKTDKINNQIKVTINGEPRNFKILNNENMTTKLLKIPVYATDNDKVLEIQGAKICIQHKKDGNENIKLVCRTNSKRLQIIDAHRARLQLGDSFELLKLLKKVKLNSTVAQSNIMHQEINAKLLLRRYWTDKLPVTEHLLTYAGVLAQFRTKYSELFMTKYEKEEVRKRLMTAKENDVLLRSPKSLAEEAILQTDEEIWSSIPSMKKATIRRIAEERGLSKEDLKYTGIKGFVVKSELKKWKV